MSYVDAALRHAEEMEAEMNKQPPACVVCGEAVDTREVEEGGSEDGCELARGGWVCSSRCYDKATNEGADE